MPTFYVTEAASLVVPQSPLHDGLEVFAGRPAEPDGRQSLLFTTKVALPWDDSLSGGRAGGMEVVHMLGKLHAWVRLIHQQLLRRAGYLYPFPESNAPQEAHDEDEAAWSGVSQENG